MIGYIFNGYIKELRSTFDAERHPVIELFSLTNISIVGESLAVLTYVSEKRWQLDISGCLDGEVIVLQNDNGEQSITVYNAKPRTDYLENWLTMQQLSHMIPVLKRLGWHKLKEAALKAKQIADMQGSEQALAMVLDLLDADNNVVLSRYWQKTSSTGTDIAFDDMHATDLADAGYQLTGKLKLAYHEDVLNPWSETVTATVRSMEASLAELVECIRKVLPATLSIANYEVIKIGLGLIKFDHMSCQTTTQHSDTDIDIAIDIPSVLQYSEEPFVYDFATNELIRVARPDEQNAENRMFVVIQISVDGTIHDFCLHIGECILQIGELSGMHRYCIVPPIGKHDMKWSYLTESGNRFTHEKSVTILPACTRQPVYALAKASQGDTNASILEPFNVTTFAIEWAETTEFCNGRPNVMHMIRPYQQFFVPITAKFVRINDGKSRRSYPLSVGANIPGFTIAIERVTVMPVSRTDMQDTADYYVLTTIDYAGKYDYTADSGFVHNKAGSIDNISWIRCTQQLSKVLTSTVEPMWNRHTMQAAINDLGQPATVKISLDGRAANRGGYMQSNIDDAMFIERLYRMEQVVCNTDHDNTFVSLSTIKSDATLSIAYDKTVDIKGVRRAPSFSLQTVGYLQESLPYVCIKANTWLDLYSNGVLTKSGYGLLVFAKTTNNKYTLHMHNEWYDKTIEL